MKQKEIFIKVYAQYNIFGTVDYMNGNTTFIKDLKSDKPVQTLRVTL